jgi:hypothetical protein
MAVSTATAPPQVGGRTAAARPAVRETAVAHVAHATTYWLSMLGVYVAVGGLWYYGAYEKIIGGSLAAPAGIEKAFAGSFMASFPGVGVSWVVISLLEALIVVGMLASAIRGEFLPTRPKPILLASLAGSVVVLGLLLFGESMIGAHDSVASLFTYIAGTFVLMAVVRVLPPSSPRDILGTTDDA